MRAAAVLEHTQEHAHRAPLVQALSRLTGASGALCVPLLLPDGVGGGLVVMSLAPDEFDSARVRREQGIHVDAAVHSAGWTPHAATASGGRGLFIVRTAWEEVACVPACLRWRLSRCRCACAAT